MRKLRYLKTVSGGTESIGSLNIGTSASPMRRLYTEKGLAFYFTCPSTNTGTSFESVLFYTTLTGAGQVGGRVKAYLTANVVLGSWCNAFKAHMNFGSSGSTNGLASAACAELDVPDRSLPSGAYYCMEAELNPGASTVTDGDGAQDGFMYMKVNTNTTDFRDYGYVFRIDGLGSAASSHVFQANTDVATHALRVNIGGATRFLLMTSVNNGTP